MTDTDKKSILIVDDEEIIRDFLFEVLCDDYNITMAEDGDIAIEKIKCDSFDLVITDMTMPRVSGEEVVKFIQESAPESKVIIISGFASLYSFSQSVNSGASAFLSKPFSIQELLQAIEAAGV